MCNVANHTIWCDCHTRPSLKQQLAQAHRDAAEEAAKAHKRGWEQAKADAVKVAKQTDFPISPKSYYTLGREDAANAIAAMEYGGESK